MRKVFFGFILFPIVSSFLNLANVLTISRRDVIGQITSANLVKLAMPQSEDEDSSEITQSHEKSSMVDPLTVAFYGAVTEESCLQLTESLKGLNVKAKQIRTSYPEFSPRIKLHIQSGGGSLMPTFYVCDVIKKMETPVDIYIDGFAASSASLMAVCGKKRYMTKHSCMLIHQLKSAASGKFNEMKDEMNNLNFFMSNVKDIYFENTNLDENTLQHLLESDLWLDADTCLKYGLVDEII